MLEEVLFKQNKSKESKQSKQKTKQHSIPQYPGEITNAHADNLSTSLQC
jgi:hypothetical protein